MISSIVLFFKRDCAGGVGPAVEAPRPAVPAVPVVPGVAPAEVPEGAVIAGLLSAVVVVPAPAEVPAGCVDDVLSAGFPNNPPVGAAGWALGAEVAAVPGVLVAVDFGAPRPENKPPDGAAAGVEEGVAEEVLLGRAPNNGLAGAALDVAGVEDSEVVAVVAVGAAGLKSDGVSVFCSPPAEAPKREGLAPLSAEVVGVDDSAGLSLFRLPPKSPPPEGADGVKPNNGFCCAFDPRRPPPDCCCGAPPNSDGVVEPLGAVPVVDGVADGVVPVFVLPKRPPGFCAV